VIRSILLGAVAGMRSMLPLAAVSSVARRSGPSSSFNLPGLLDNPLTANSLLALAAGELLGDKWSRAPDRISSAGLAARVATGAVAGAAVSPREQRWAGGVLGAAAALVGGYVSFTLRARAMRRFGQVPTGLAEDAVALAATLWILNTPR
jgi:uncharacterized membrane protein